MTASPGNFAWAIDVLQSDFIKKKDFRKVLDLQNYYEDSAENSHLVSAIINVLC